MMLEDKKLDYSDKQQLNQKRQVKLKTCADVYEHWRAYKRLYKKAPKDGIEFQIDYIDTGLSLSSEERAKAPIALALHGAPGSYHDYALLIQHLSQQNVRVIAPNFPEYTATVKTKVLFRHSADEKAAYLRDFLKAINVNKIDLLISHSSAIFPTLLILLNANNEAIKAQRRSQQESSNNNNNNCCSLDSKSKAAAAAAEQENQAKFVLIKNKLQADEDVGDDDEELETFEDAKDEIDDNNNRHRLGESNINATNSSSTDINGAGDDEQNECENISETTTIDLNDDCNCSMGCKNNGETIVDKFNSYDESKENETIRRSSKKTTTVLRKKKRKQHGDSDVIVKFDQPIEIKAVALLNPAGHRLPKSMKPTWFKCGSVHVYQHKFGRSLFRKFGPAFLTVVGVPVRVDNMDNVMLSATVMRNSKCQRVIKQLEQLSQMKIPTLLVFSENDKLIEKEIFYEMTQFMRLDSKNFDVFNNDGNIELSQSIMEDWIRVMVFKAGGHYAYSNYAKTVNQAVSQLLNKVVD